MKNCRKQRHLITPVSLVNLPCNVKEHAFHFTHLSRPRYICNEPSFFVNFERNWQGVQMGTPTFVHATSMSHFIFSIPSKTPVGLFEVTQESHCHSICLQKYTVLGPHVVYIIGLLINIWNTTFYLVFSIYNVLTSAIQ